MNEYSTMTQRYFDMLVQQSYSNEEKLGASSDSVASKLERLVPEILANQKLKELIINKMIENNNEIISLGNKGIIQGDRQKQIWNLSNDNRKLQSLLDESGII